jgi:hypothetical protein
MRTSAIILFFLWAAALAPISAAQPAPLSDAQTKSVAAAMIGYVEKIYVFPEKRAQIAGAIRSDLAKSRYAVPTQKELAERLTETLIAASKDKHLTVSFDPPRSQALAKPGEPQDNSFFDAEGLKWNQGYDRQEILPGNVRYVRIKTFFWTDDVTARVIDSAAQFLSGGSAVIIDLRGNDGGHSLAVQRMISYLLPEKPVELMTFFDGLTGKSETTYSAAKLPAARIARRPVYVLTDQGSASAAEEFAYHVQQYKLGTLIGETTAGAANNNVLLPLPEGFVASVSAGRPVHPVSKTNWEGVGVAPDKPVPSPAALDAALVEALTGLAQSGDAQIKAEAAWELPAVKARVTPVRLAPEALKRLAGKYGERHIRWSGDRLTLQRSGGGVRGLVPLESGLFAIEGMDAVRVRLSGHERGAPLLEMIYKDGRIQAAKRDGEPG